MKRVLVTGGNKGIGLAVVERVLTERSDTAVLLGSRSAARGAAARDVLLAKQPDWATRLEVLPLDVADAAQVSAAAADVAARFGDAALYGVVNNAGVAEGGAATIIDVNLRSVKRVTDAFAPLLAPGADARVVNVSSGSAPMFVAQCTPERQRFFTDASVTWAQLDAAAEEYVAAVDAAAADGGAALAALGYPRSADEAYGFSKAALNVYTMQLAASLQGVRVNACSPGFIVTDLTKRMMAVRGGGRTPEEAGALPTEKGTIAISYLLFGDPPAPGGRYYGSDGLRSPLDKYRSPGSPPYDGQ